MTTVTVTYQDGIERTFDIGPDNRVKLVPDNGDYSIEDVTGLDVDIHKDHRAATPIGVGLKEGTIKKVTRKDRQAGEPARASRLHPESETKPTQTQSGVTNEPSEGQEGINMPDVEGRRHADSQATTKSAAAQKTAGTSNTQARRSSQARDRP